MVAAIVANLAAAVVHAVLLETGATLSHIKMLLDELEAMVDERAVLDERHKHIVETDLHDASLEGHVVLVDDARSLQFDGLDLRWLVQLEPNVALETVEQLVVLEELIHLCVVQIQAASIKVHLGNWQVCARRLEAHDEAACEAAILDVNVAHLKPLVHFVYGKVVRRAVERGVHVTLVRVVDAHTLCLVAAAQFRRRFRVTFLLLLASFAIELLVAFALKASILRHVLARRQRLCDVMHVLQRGRFLNAFAVVLARIHLALVDVDLALLAREAVVTHAPEVAYFVDALARAIIARPRGAIVYVDLAILARKAALAALAAIVVDEIVTSGIVSTRIARCALVHVVLAILALPAWLAFARVICSVIDAFGVVQTRRARAHIHRFLAPLAPEAWRAFAPVVADVVDAIAAIVARLCNLTTLVDVDRARLACESGQTKTFAIETLAAV